MSALVSAPDDDGAQQLRTAKCLMKSGKYDEAIATLRGIPDGGTAGTGSSADGAEVLVCLSSCHCGRADWAAAVACAEEALVREPQHARAYLALARGLHGDGRFDAAVEACDAGLRTAAEGHGQGQEPALTQWRGVCQRARDGVDEPSPLRWRRLNPDGSVADGHDHAHAHAHTHDGAGVEHSHSHTHDSGAVHSAHDHTHAHDHAHDHAHGCTEHSHSHAHDSGTAHTHAHSEGMAHDHTHDSHDPPPSHFSHEHGHSHAR